MEGSQVKENSIVLAVDLLRKFLPRLTDKLCLKYMHCQIIVIIMIMSLKLQFYVLLSSPSCQC